MVTKNTVTIAAATRVSTKVTPDSLWARQGLVILIKIAAECVPLPIIYGYYIHLGPTTERARRAVLSRFLSSAIYKNARWRWYTLRMSRSFRRELPIFLRTSVLYLVRRLSPKQRDSRLSGFFQHHFSFQN